MAKVRPESDASTDGTKILHIDLACIDLDAQMIRAELDEDFIAELALDIATNGLLQPIGVYPVAAGRYQLLWGRCRFEAHRRLRRTTIRAQITTHTMQDVKGVAARENLLRRQLTLGEEVDVVCRFHHEDKLSPDQIASRISKSRAWVLRRLSFPSLPAFLRCPVLEGRLAIAAAERIALLPSTEAQAYVFQCAEQQRLTVGQVDELCQTILAAPNMEEAVAAGVEASATLTASARFVAQCFVCHREKGLAELQLIRVCLTGCDASTDPAPTERKDN